MTDGGLCNPNLNFATLIPLYIITMSTIYHLQFLHFINSLEVEINKTFLSFYFRDTCKLIVVKHCLIYIHKYGQRSDNFTKCIGFILPFSFVRTWILFILDFMALPKRFVNSKISYTFAANISNKNLFVRKSLNIAFNSFLTTDGCSIELWIVIV